MTSDEIRPTIYLVDDEPELLDAMTHLLNSGFRSNLKAFTKATDLIEEVKKKEPDLIISDILMPEMIGVQMLQRIRSLGYLTPVVFLTAHGSKKYLIQAVRLGASDFIEKPFRDNDVIDTVFKQLDIARREREMGAYTTPSTQSRMIGLMKAARSQLPNE